MSEGIVASAAAPDIRQSPEFQEALKQQREQDRAGFDAEYRRKEKELMERAPTPAPSNGQGADWFEGWSQRHGLPTEAGRELATVVIQHVAGTTIPISLKPLSEAYGKTALSQKRQELRAQRQEVREANPKLATLDAKYHAEVMQLLEPMDPSHIGPDSYLRALHMVIGKNIESLESDRAAQPAREIAPGPEPTAASGPAKSAKTTLNARQLAFCEERGFGEGDFVEMMRDRARKLEGQGMTKPQVRTRLGELLGSLEF